MVPYRSNRPLAFLVSGLLAAQALGCVVLGAALSVECRTDDEALLDTLDRVIDRVGQGADVAYVVCAVLFLVWLWRAYRNLPALGSTSTELTPGAAVLGWFLPLANLVRGYASVRHLWIESQPGRATLPSGEVLPRRARLVGWWWGFYILSLPALRVISMQGPMMTEEALVRASYAWNAALGLHAVAAVLCIAVVMGIERRQRAQHDDLIRRQPIAPATDRLR